MVLENKAGISYANKLTIFVIIYGVSDYVNNVHTSVWDRLFEVTNNNIKFEAAIDMGNHSIKNLKDSQPSDVSHAASVGYVAKRIQQYEELSIESVVKMNVFKNVMANNLFKNGNG